MAIKRDQWMLRHVTILSFKSHVWLRLKREVPADLFDFVEHNKSWFCFMKEPLRLLLAGHLPRLFLVSANESGETRLSRVFFASEVAHAPYAK